MSTSCKGHRFPPEIISLAVWLCHRFTLSFRDVEDMLAERGIIVSYETIRFWCLKFGQEYARTLRKKQGQLGDIWHVDEVFVKIQGQLSLSFIPSELKTLNLALFVLIMSLHDPGAASKFVLFTDYSSSPRS